ncbi:MAG: transporter [Mucilaginibacter sp.]|nr:transporter [Mucilaginibacter sp.]
MALFSMRLKPVETVSDSQLNSGLKLIIADGLSAEAMVVFTSGTFLTAMAIHMGASNFQLGLFAALPTFTTIFQLLSVWLVQKFNNRKLVTSAFNLLARVPLLAVGIMPLLFTGTTSIMVLLTLLFFQHIFGDIAGASWNAWMKDLIPEGRLGSFFSRRTRIAQTLNVTLSLATALCIDYVKAHYPAHEITAYSMLFLAGGMLGMASVFLLLRTPEPQPVRMKGNVMTLFGKSLKNKNFRNLLVFNSIWAFALNLATPFFAVYMMKTLQLPLSYVIGLTILGQLSGIVALKLWGNHSDRFSNKTIIRIWAPLYICCILGFAFTDMSSSHVVMLVMLVLIHILSGTATASINLALSNIGMKLAPKNEAMVYISSKNMFVAFFSTIAPMIGGLMADFFASHQFAWNLQFSTNGQVSNFGILTLHGWNYFFIIGGLIALLSLRLLTRVKEEGEVSKGRAVIYMRAEFKNKLRNNRPAGYSLESSNVSISKRAQIVRLFKRKTANQSYKRSA